MRRSSPTILRGAWRMRRQCISPDRTRCATPVFGTRQYVDELFEQTDVTGYSPSTSYGFDQYAGDPVHADIVKITDNELIGSNAVRSLILVDLSATGATATTAPAMKRNYAVIPDSEGGSMDAYTYTGNFRSKGEKVTGTATTEDDWQTITFA